MFVLLFQLDRVQDSFGGLFSWALAGRIKRETGYENIRELFPGVAETFQAALNHRTLDAVFKHLGSWTFHCAALLGPGLHWRRANGTRNIESYQLVRIDYLLKSQWWKIQLFFQGGGWRNCRFWATFWLRLFGSRALGGLREESSLSQTGGGLQHSTQKGRLQAVQRQQLRTGCNDLCVVSVCDHL